MEKYHVPFIFNKTQIQHGHAKLSLITTNHPRYSCDSTIQIIRQFQSTYTSAFIIITSFMLDFSFEHWMTNVANAMV